MKKRNLIKLLSLATVFITSICVFCACNDRDDFRNTRKGEPETGQFYSVQTAYDNGWLCRGDLRTMAYYLMGNGREDGFGTYPLVPDRLDDATKLAIRQSYAEKRSVEGITVEDVTITGCYGVYFDGRSNLIAIRITTVYDSYPAVVYRESIGGVEFVYPNTNTIRLCKA